ncbi:sugar transporter [Rhodonellum psychrophilum GCM71 = DSM 17998]|uniref:Sugar transporter n=2 Tax=Rhodonellum TaxID=336827 RepID=U5BWN0_9BACT|nr:MULTISPECIES: polysaccharide biosynthesis/export family protein [Rhodonellum]ERM81016.1 sugar transporter [Rhodonellum psychrophilum GCM71 = DSM 17998]SDZ41482.1 polysaccharide export outer membrane protein [Rhodonellum ikkaensis]
MKKKIPFLVIASLILFSCSKRNLVYFNDLDATNGYSSPITTLSEPRIQEDDLLSITVTSLNPESNLLFNAGVIMPSQGNFNTNVSSPINENYLVDKDGFINYPVIGKINLRGLTKQEGIVKITQLLDEYVKNPIINIRFMNFKVTVIGEVQQPSSFIIPTEKITILEALGLAGDMTAYGKRENVLVIREKDGIRSANRLNLNDKAVLDSPFYYLQQNDVVYVEPYKTKALQADNNPRTFALLSTGLTLAVVLVLNFNNIF